MPKRSSRKNNNPSRKRRRSVSGKILPPIDVRSASSFGEMVKRITQGPLTIVLVYADWCGHCHQFMPHFDAAANDQGRSIQAVKINENILSKANEYLNKNVNKNAKAINVEGYPSVLLVKKDGSVVSEVEAQKDTDAMKKVMSQTGPVAEEAGLDTPISVNNRNQKAMNLGMEDTGASEGSVRNYDVNEGSMLGTKTSALDDANSTFAPPVKTDKSTSINVSPSEVKKIASLHSYQVSLGSNTGLPPNHDHDMDDVIPGIPSKKGGSLYQTLSQSAYTLAPAAILLATAAGLRHRKRRTKKRSKKSLKTKRRSRK